MKPLRVLLVALLICLLPGCGDRIDVEDLTLALMVGLDLDDKNNLIVYMASPVFSEEARKKQEEFGVKATTFRQSRGKYDAVVTALTVGGKIQVVLVGKRLLRHPDWFPLLDVLYRDAELTVNARVVAVDGDVAEVINFFPSDKPRLALHMTKLIDTANRRNITVKTTLQQLHRQMYEPGMTPSISEVKKTKQIEVIGTALLDEKGKYKTSLLLEENVLLHMLLIGKKGDISLTIPVTDTRKSGGIVKKRISFAVQNVSKQIKTSYRRGKFAFDIKLNMSVILLERYVPLDLEKKEKQITQMIQKQLEKEYKHLIANIQKYKIDPVGLGLYARAYQYGHWKKVQGKWGETLAKADIKVTPIVKIKASGVIK